MLKLYGFGVAVAVIVDAVLIRRSWYSRSYVSLVTGTGGRPKPLIALCRRSGIHD